MPVRGVDDVGFDHQILVDEIGAVGVVGVDAADLARGEKHVFRLLTIKKLVDRTLIGKVKLLMSSEDQGLRTVTTGKQAADDGGAPR